MRCRGVASASACSLSRSAARGSSRTRRSRCEKSGAATGSVQNDRMQATVRIEADNASASQAASDVNARMAKALARAKGTAGVESKSAGYSTWQTWEKGKPSKWKVVQSLQLTSTDFAALAALVSRLQDEDGLMVSDIAFSVSPDARRKAEEAHAQAVTALNLASKATRP